MMPFPPSDDPPFIESYVKHIGGFRFFVRRRDFTDGRATMMDRRGRVLARFKAEGKVDVGRVPELDGDGSLKVLISTWSGGAHGGFGYYVLSLSPKPHCLLAFWKGNGEGVMGEDMDMGGDLTPIDLDGDGEPELLSWYDGFAYRIAAYSSTPRVPLVFKFRHGRYVEATAHFPAFLRRQARSAWYRLQDDLHDPDLITRNRADAVGFLAPKIILGEEGQAWHLLRKVMVPWKFASLYRQRAWVRAVVQDRKRSIQHPLLSHLPPTWKHVYRTEGPWG